MEGSETTDDSTNNGYGCRAGFGPERLSFSVNLEHSVGGARGFEF